MARYTDDSRDRVRDAVDMVDLVGSRVELRRAGANRYEGLCPFHDERTPSFGINPAEKLFYCFGCGQGGDAFKFVELTEGIDFKGALEHLADRYGVQLELVEEDPASAERRRERERLLELLERTTAFYVRYLWDSAEAAGARTYLAGRGLEEGTLREFRVGYAPSAWDKVLLASRRERFNDRELVAAGLAQRTKGEGRTYDRFRRRIMFPLCDARGRVLGFGARALGADQKPKYLNSSDNVVFHKGRHLFGADIARAHAAKAGCVVVAEGYTDVIALHQAGLRNTVGLMGTALTEEQVKELKRLAPTVLLALDADMAGQDAMVRAEGLASSQGLGVRVVAMPPGTDPADLLLAEGHRAMEALIEESESFVRFRVRQELSHHDLSDPEGKQRAVDALAPILATVALGPIYDDLVRTISDAMNARPDAVVSMLPARRTASRGTTRAIDDDLARRALNEAASTAADFLAQCIAAPVAGKEALMSLRWDDIFDHDLLRRAARHLSDHIDDPIATLTPDDSELSAFLARLSVRAGELEPTANAVEVALLSVELARVERAIVAARTKGTPVGGLVAERTQLKERWDAAIGRQVEETRSQD